MSAERVGPDEAHRIGLVDECAGDEALRDTARVRAHAIARNAPIAVQDLRAVPRRPLLAAVAEALGCELKRRLQHIRTRDFAEGIGALLSRRPPVFVND
ncbi:MAG: hypothetical protein KGJ75_04135 [Alphaproteobacteria bacterium]|nr:hypothetical protein [Alphaproteobacteria bacterium]MDE2012094.1 hypothetical protein [Alphaproteobacteria bacterium]